MKAVIENQNRKPKSVNNKMDSGIGSIPDPEYGGSKYGGEQ